jgi:16S rRNA (uracil1498-N3)-methyltransferase
MAFYRIVITPPHPQQQWIALSQEQSHYLQRVLRLKNGDRFVAMDGQGQAWLAELQAEKAHLLDFLPESTELNIAVTLLVALPKGNGFEEIIRPCTELGVSTLMPVISDRTLLKPSPNKGERWQKIAREAAEQSERQWVPDILEPCSFKEALINLKDCGSEAYICVTRRESPLLWSCLETQRPNRLLIATGPEGGWTDTEIEQAIAVGFKPVSLGKRILRAITAPTVVMSLVANFAELR